MCKGTDDKVIHDRCVYQSALKRQNAVKRCLKLIGSLHDNKGINNYLNNPSGTKFSKQEIQKHLEHNFEYFNTSMCMELKAYGANCTPSNSLINSFINDTTDTTFSMVDTIYKKSKHTTLHYRKILLDDLINSNYSLNQLLDKIKGSDNVNHIIYLLDSYDVLHTINHFIINLKTLVNMMIDNKDMDTKDIIDTVILVIYSHWIKIYNNYIDKIS